MKTKRCSQCDKVYAITKFYTKARYGQGRRHSECKYCTSNSRHTRMRALVYRMLAHYSGGFPPKCACCGEANTEFLAVDHPANDGAAHRREIVNPHDGGKGKRFRQWLISNGCPPGYRVLCHNCNMSIAIYGYCPHKESRRIFEIAHETYDGMAQPKHYMLTQAIADEIREIDARKSMSEADILKKYKIKMHTLYAIRSKRQWKGTAEKKKTALDFMQDEVTK